MPQEEQENGHTGERCQKKGLYETVCFDKFRQYFRKGETFPPCPSCGQSVDWTVVSADS